MGRFKIVPLCLFISVMFMASCGFGNSILPETNSEDQTEIVMPDAKEKTMPTPKISEEITDVPEIPKKTPQPVPLNYPQIGFGYTNIDGDKLIVLYDHEVDDNKSFTYFEYAVGENGRAFEIEYNFYQKMGVGNNGRQSAINFDKEAGCIYNVVNAAAIPNDTYMLLSKEEYEKIMVLQENENLAIIADSNELTVKCAVLAGRKTKNGWQLAEYQDGIKVSMVEFENMGTDLLAWLALEDGENFQYCEFPATLSDDGFTGWAYEDMGEIDTNWINVLCTVKKEQITIVYLEWFDTEGRVIIEVKFYKDKKPDFRSVGGRYTYPV